MLDCRTALVLVVEVPHFGCCLVVLDCSKRLVLEVLVSDAGWTVLDCRTMAGFIRQVFGVVNLLFQGFQPFYCCLFEACGLPLMKHCLRLRSAICFICVFAVLGWLGGFWFLKGMTGVSGI